MNAQINIQRLRANLDTLGRFGLQTEGGITRESFGEADRKARAWLADTIRAAGLELRTDAAGNTFGRLGPPGPAVMAGSHIDTVPQGGKFDGALGVLAALECLQTAQEQGLSTGCALEMVAFTDEEGSFHGFLGSRALTGRLDPAELARACNLKGQSLRQAMTAVGLDMDTLHLARRDPDQTLAYLELHIEQGPRLADTRVPIGIVQSIVGMICYWITFEGEPNHAGTTPMDARRDPFLGAADFCLRVNDHIRTNGRGVVTCGVIRLQPGAFNIIPANARLALEFRAAEPTRLAAMEQEILSIGQEVARQRDLEFTAQRDFFDSPVVLDGDVQAVLAREAERLGYEFKLMDSGAAHDAQVLAAHTRVGMIFVPSIDGKSHCPQENSDWADIAKGTQLLLNSMLTLAAPLRSPHV